MSLLGNLMKTASGLLGTVDTAAQAATKTVNIGSSYLDQLERHAKKTSHASQVDTKYAMKVYAKEAKERHWTESAKRRKALRQEIEGDAALKREYLALKDEFDAIEAELNDELGAI